MSLLKRTLLVLISLSGVFLVSCGGTFLIIISNLNLGNGSRSTLQIGEIIGTIAGIILLIFSVYLAFLTFKKFIGPAFAYFCLGFFGVISILYGCFILYDTSHYLITYKHIIGQNDILGLFLGLTLLSTGCYSLWVIYKKRVDKNKSI